MEIRFADHASFQRAAVGMVGSALLFGAALHPVTELAPLAGGLLGIAVGAAIAHGLAIWRMAAAGLGLALLFMAPGSGASVVGAAGCVALGLSLGGPRGVRGVVGLLVGALATVVALWCADRIGHARETVAWSPLARTAMAAAAVGIVGVLAMLPRQLELVLDPVKSALGQLPASVAPEVRGLCARATAIWEAARDRFPDDEGKRLLREGVLKALEVAARSAGVELTGPSDTELAKRMSELDQRITAATDPEVKTQYRAARAALEDQQRLREHIRNRRERLIARMHNHVAVLEKLELAATGLSAARAASAGGTTLKQLEELSLDVAASGDALTELELGDAPAVRAPSA